MIKKYDAPQEGVECPINPNESIQISFKYVFFPSSIAITWLPLDKVTRHIGVPTYYIEVLNYMSYDWMYMYWWSKIYFRTYQSSFHSNLIVDYWTLQTKHLSLYQWMYVGMNYPIIGKDASSPFPFLLQNCTDIGDVVLCTYNK